MKPIIQNHHIIYENPEHKQKEITVKIFKGEHWLISNLNRRKNISRGFLIALKVWITLNENNAKELGTVLDDLKIVRAKQKTIITERGEKGYVKRNKKTWSI